MEKFAIGVVVGGLCGVLLATNNYKMRTLVKKGQEEMQSKLDQLMDEKIQQMEDGVETVKEKAKTVKDEIKKTAKKAVQNWLTVPKDFGDCTF